MIRLEELLAETTTQVYCERNGSRFRLCLEQSGPDIGVSVVPMELPLSWDVLTAREREVMALVVQGQPYRVISKQLFISEGTVKKTAHNAYRKLNVSSRLELIRRMM